MSNNFIQNATLRTIGLTGRRVIARSQIWREGPRILVNSIPKAGTHLLTSELDRIDSLQNSYLHILIKDILQGRENAEGYDRVDAARLSRDIDTVRPGQFFSAHLPWAPEIETVLTRAEVKTIFVTRDPRAIISSRYHYIMGLNRHYLHDFFAAEQFTDIERFKLLVEGHPGEPFMKPLKWVLDQYAPWIDSDETLAVRFEELVGAKGGGSDTLKRATFEKIAGHIGIPVSQLPETVTQSPSRTATLRKGKVDSWQEEIPAEILELIDKECGPSLRKMGYT